MKVGTHAGKVSRPGLESVAAVWRTENFVAPPPRLEIIFPIKTKIGKKLIG